MGPMSRDHRHRAGAWPRQRVLFWCAFAVFLSPIVYVQMWGGGYPVPIEKIRNTRFLVTCSLIAIVVMCGLIVLDARRKRVARERLRQGLCSACGYDLRAHATGDRCPECGAPVPAIRTSN